MAREDCQGLRMQTELRFIYDNGVRGMRLKKSCDQTQETNNSV